MSPPTFKPTPTKLRRRIRLAVRLTFASLLVLTLFIGCQMISMPGKSFTGPLPPITPQEQTCSDNLTAHVATLATKIGPRSLAHPAKLAEAAAYIESQFASLGYTPASQSFQSRGETVRNIEVEIPGTSKPSEILIIGAHYDSVPDSPAANDNASGVAALLELARLMSHDKPARTIRFVAFVNEEPPYYHTAEMGSLVYAQRCAARHENIVAMFSLETMGYYSDAPHTQNYPAPLSLFYPSTGNFIAFVGNYDSRQLVYDTIRSFRTHAQFPSEGAALPGFLTGIDWSDHWSFWQHGYPALQITDTAPFRYPHYHTPQDTPGKIDPTRLARVVISLIDTFRSLSN